MFEINRNVWRIARAKRAAVLIDGAAMFLAVREAMLQAKRCIFIVGWDIDSRVRLVGPDGKADDGFPETLAEFLTALVKRRPELQIHVQLWDYSVVYALEREALPTISLDWNTPEQVRVFLDDEAPFGCSQHQKIVVVDDAIAFSGGLDLTVRRWDTCAHDANNPTRVDPDGAPYAPFHDVQIMVDGEAAHAMAELVRERWKPADIPAADFCANADECWPTSFAPDFTDVDVGISRTMPCTDDAPQIREVEQLFLDMVDQAQRTLYIENQFLTEETIAHRIARRMKRVPGLETVFVSPQTPEAWVEAHTMRNGRIRFRKILEEAGCGERWRLVYPEVQGGDEPVATMVHSKVMIVDDTLLRIGSANLNNRSMGADSECDITIHAQTPEHRAAIVRIRNTLVGDHCGASPEEVATALEETESLITVVDGVSQRGHALRNIDDGEPDHSDIAAKLEAIADPRKPWRIGSAFSWMMAGSRSVRRFPLSKIAAIVTVLLGLTAIWYYSPLAAYAQPEEIQRILESTESGWGAFIAIGAFVVGGFVSFPVTILIAATVAAFGVWPGLIYAATGAMASALTMYGVGAWLGQDTLKSLLGKRLDRTRKYLSKQGILAIAAIRLVPLAPFTVVNLAAGAARIDFRMYAAGTLLGLTPGVLAITIFAQQIFDIIAAPSISGVAILVVALAAWIGVTLAIQAAVSRARDAQ